MKNSFLTIEEVSERLHINTRTAHNRLYSGKKMPPSVKIGKKRLFPEKLFEEWMESQVESHDIIAIQKITGGRIRR